jgi:hypothetical protein
MSYEGAHTVVVSSASSKTAYCLAFLLKQRGVPVVGLTSTSNVDFVGSLNVYDQVVLYDQIASDLPTRSALLQAPLVYVDVAGSPEVQTSLTQHVHVVGVISVGMSHVGGPSKSTAAINIGMEMTKLKRIVFFASAWIKQRQAEWGQAETLTRMGTAWALWAANVEAWMDVRIFRGLEGAELAYSLMYRGRTPAREGLVVKLGTQEQATDTASRRSIL